MRNQNISLCACVLGHLQQGKRCNFIAIMRRRMIRRSVTGLGPVLVGQTSTESGIKAKLIAGHDMAVPRGVPRKTLARQLVCKDWWCDWGHTLSGEVKQRAAI